MNNADMSISVSQVLITTWLEAEVCFFCVGFRFHSFTKLPRPNVWVPKVYYKL